jgi:hypothetical protein
MLHCPGTEKPVPNGARYGWVIDSYKEPDEALSLPRRCRKTRRRGAGEFRAETAEDRWAQRDLHPPSPHFRRPGLDPGSRLLLFLESEMGEQGQLAS